MDARKPSSPTAAPFLFGGDVRRHTPRVVAEKTAEMMCYLWFAQSPPRLPSPSHPRRQRRQQPSPRQDPARTALQFQPTDTFIQFLLKVLETTQVSQSVIVLSLHYVFRLKDKNDMTMGQPGSELRVAVVALMLANKFVDDNTYTNKTWSEISGIGLDEINKMEREFLGGVSYNLFVDDATYRVWLTLLKGFVAAKEREQQQWQSSMRRRTDSSIAPPRVLQNQRARSSSPMPTARSPEFPFTFAPPAIDNTNPFISRTDDVPPTPYVTAPTPIPVTGKRPAQDAFSPPSVAAHARMHPHKRPVSLDLASAFPGRSFAGATTDEDIEMDGAPQYLRPTSSVESLNAFAKMSISPSRPHSPPQHPPLYPLSTSSSSSQVLAAPYRFKEKHRRESQPLYFYTLAGSPSGDSNSGHVRDRKGKLHFHHPPSHYEPSPAPSWRQSQIQRQTPQNLPTPGVPMQPYSQGPVPVMPMSAHTSPAQPRNAGHYVLPPLNDIARFQQQAWTPPKTEYLSPVTLLPQLHILPAQRQYSHPPHMLLTPPPSAGRAAQFANAGPAGVRMPWAPSSTARTGGFPLPRLQTAMVQHWPQAPRLQWI